MASLKQVDSRIALDKRAVLNRYEKTAQVRPYQLDCIEEITDALAQGKDVDIDLPTGSGKTVIYVPAAIEAADQGKRVAILAPTKAAQNRIAKEVKRFGPESAVETIYGYNEYFCPVIQNKAENWLCGELKEKSCIPNALGCGVIRSDDAYAKHSLIITNFAKFLSAHSKTTFDLVIIDDSHSFENAKEQAFQVIIRYDTLVTAEQQFASNPLLTGVLSSLRAIFAVVWSRCVSPGKFDGNIADDYVKQIADTIVTPENKEPILNAIRSLSPDDQKVLWDAYYFVARCQKRTHHLFFVRRDYYGRNDIAGAQLIARQSPDNERFLVRRRFGGARVILSTATPGNVFAHASACTTRRYSEQSLDVVPASRHAEIENWFKNLKIYAIRDLGEAKDGETFQRCLGLTGDILTAVRVKSLILFKNYRDQRLARDGLESRVGAGRMYFIDEVKPLDFVDEISNLKEVIVASASSTIWEGINIDGLRLVVIISPPFIKPPVAGSKESGYQHGERRMLMRLQQGIGRVIRDPNDFGAAVLMDSKFQRYVKNREFSERLKQRVVGIDSSQLLSSLSLDLGNRGGNH